MSESFKSILVELGVRTAPETHHHARLGWVQFDCPFCSPNTHRYRMGYNVATRAVNCWMCGRHNLPETLLNLGCKSLREAIRLSKGLPIERGVEKRLSAGKLTPPKGIGPLKGRHRQYLKGRGFNPDEIVDLWGVQGIGIASKYRWTLYIPIYLYGEVVSFTTRQLHDDGIRYCTASPEEERVHHKELLYGSDYCRDTVVILEGPTDVWNFGPGAVCTFGTQWTEAQLRELVKFPNRVVIFDPEAGAQRRARELVDWLSDYDGETYNVAEWQAENGATDIGSADKPFIQALRKAIFENVFEGGVAHGV